MREFDLVVIGGGPGGYTAALKAAQLGKRVALCEKAEIGGTCLNRGCIPTKALLRAAHTYRSMAEAQAVGVVAANLQFNFAAAQQFAHQTVETLRQNVEQLLAKAKVEVFRGDAVVEKVGVVRVGDELLHTTHLLVATGSRPAKIPLPGSDLPGVLDSDQLLAGQGAHCEHLVIIGGGVIGAEFAELYTAIGRKVTVLELAPRLLPGLDRELGQSLAMLLKKRGAEIFTGVTVTGITQGQEGLVCTVHGASGEQQVTGDRVLICTGRTPNTDGLFAPGLKLGLHRGFLPTDEYGETALAGIWAIGDVVLGGIALAHAAEAGAENAVSGMFGGPKLKNTVAIPSCVYTDPPIACVGYTADEAKAAGYTVQTEKSLTSANGRAVIMGAPRGFAKLVFDEVTGRLLGAQLMAPNADEMIGGLVIAITAGLTRDQLREVVWPHPTVSEILKLS